MASLKVFLILCLVAAATHSKPLAEGPLDPSNESLPREEGRQVGKEAGMTRETSQRQIEAGFDSPPDAISDFRRQNPQLPDRAGQQFGGGDETNIPPPDRQRQPSDQRQEQLLPQRGGPDYSQLPRRDDQQRQPEFQGSERLPDEERQLRFQGSERFPDQQGLPQIQGDERFPDQQGQPQIQGSERFPDQNSQPQILGSERFPQQITSPEAARRFESDMTQGKDFPQQQQQPLSPEIQIPGSVSQPGQEQRGQAQIPQVAPQQGETSPGQPAIAFVAVRRVRPSLRKVVGVSPLPSLGTQQAPYGTPSVISNPLLYPRIYRYDSGDWSDEFFDSDSVSEEDLLYYHPSRSAPWSRPRLRRPYSGVYDLRGLRRYASSPNLGVSRIYKRDVHDENPEVEEPVEDEPEIERERRDADDEPADLEPAGNEWMTLVRGSVVEVSPLGQQQQQQQQQRFNPRSDPNLCCYDPPRYPYAGQRQPASPRVPPLPIIILQVPVGKPQDQQPTAETATGRPGDAATGPGTTQTERASQSSGGEDFAGSEPTNEPLAEDLTAVERSRGRSNIPSSAPMKADHSGGNVQRGGDDQPFKQIKPFEALVDFKFGRDHAHMKMVFPQGKGNYEVRDGNGRLRTAEFDVDERGNFKILDSDERTDKEAMTKFLAFSAGNVTIELKLDPPPKERINATD